MGDIKMEGLGAIVRTAAEGKETKDLKKDFKALQKRWKQLKKLADKELPPAIVYEDENMTVRLIRDVLDDRFKGIRSFRHRRKASAAFQK
jgi:ribonuclease E